MSNQKVITTAFHFLGGAVLPATANEGYGLVKKITAAAGSPTVAKTNGAAVLTLDNTNEVQNLCLYADDNLAFDIDDIVQFRAWLAVSVAIGTAATWALGLASARNDTPGSMTALALFTGGTSGVISTETDDNVTDTAPVSSGLALGTTFKKLVIDFSKGNYTASPPSLSKGGKGAVEFSAEDANGTLIPVNRGTRFDMSGYTAGLQPFVQLQKTAATDLGAIKVARIEIDHRVLA